MLLESILINLYLQLAFRYNCDGNKKSFKYPFTEMCIKHVIFTAALNLKNN